jgi:RIO kinase 1
MSRQRGLEEKTEERVRRYEEERLMKTKRSEEFEVIEEVFDKPTREAVYELMKRGIIDEIYGAVKAGKEARIYWGVNPKKRELAIKIYYTVTAEFRQGMLKYIQNDYRFKRVKNTPRGIIYVWAQKEFRNLKAAHEAGVKVPEPIEIERNVLVMEFIGENGEPALLLHDIHLEKPRLVYNRLLEEVKILYKKAELVHGDLSEYNVMFWKEEPVLIDISQAVPTNHPLAEELLLRDIGNLNRYFSSLGVKVVDVKKAYRRITGGGKGLR